MTAKLIVSFTKARKSEMPAGRPSKFDEKYCEEVLEAGRQGYSLTAFAGMIGVCRDTISEWKEVHPEFSAALKRHAAARTYCLESDLLRAENGPKVTSRIFALKNAAPSEWRDRQEHEHSGPDGAPIAVMDVSDADRAKALAAFLAKTKNSS